MIINTRARYSCLCINTVTKCTSWLSKKGEIARDYGIAFMDGTKKKSKKTMEQLYQESDVEALKLDLEAQYQAKMDKLSMDNEEALKTQITSLERHYKAKEEELEREYQNKHDEIGDLLWELRDIKDVNLQKRRLAVKTRHEDILQKELSQGPEF